VGVVPERDEDPVKIEENKLRGTWAGVGALISPRERGLVRE